MTALPVILFHLTCHGDQRARGVQFQPTCKLCRESHKTQVWLCFLLLSLLSTSTCAISGNEIDGLRVCLQRLTPDIEKSDAMLYAPSVNESPKNCANVVLKCYMLELIMIIEEEEIRGDKPECFYDFNDSLQSDVGSMCPPCEAYTLQNITVFLDRLNEQLQLMKSELYDI